ncbi:MBL fold metallo-hydrolase [Rivibacter subsaxonicus]|uniref:N-acyl-phosphatidylethanolamine-hydrolysing phospholipase D n=1 Tax=Rivibacter subsaxonicus TaxID=457575 RepID=A0A4Q7VVS3_9BURK|nr:MBL fold metallo-hydrolase [Rivibacter subsaxonicus]RZU00693.1 N-acyl-phosphatidylethanolamine-hydrolysing phospholipase D [Rivibacter subsaxonicus]
MNSTDEASPPSPQRPSARRRGAPLAAALLAAVGWAQANPAFDPAKPHHRPDGFQNRYTEFKPKGLLELMQWRWDAWRNNLPPPPTQPIPTVAADRAFIDANARAGAAMQPAVTWVGHATVLAQFGGLNVITDPVFSQRASPFESIGPLRAQPPALAAAELPHIDVVLISHNHYDHLDEASVVALNAQAGGPPLFIVPLGLKAWLAGVGIANAVELDWWDGHKVPGGQGTQAPVEFVLTPVQHWSGRSINDRLQTLWGGFAAFAPDLHFFFAGDTGYSPDFKDIARHFAARQGREQGGGFDIALIPIGAFEPRWFMKIQHVNPVEAVQIHRDLGAKRSLGVHWGTFELTDEPRDQPPRDLAAARKAQGVAEEDFFTLAIGETRKLPRRP